MVREAVTSAEVVVEEAEVVVEEAEVVVEEAAEEPAPRKLRSKSRESLAIRKSSNSWWCPNEDTASPLTVAACPVCGFAPDLS